MTLKAVFQFKFRLIYSTLQIRYRKGSVHHRFNHTSQSKSGKYGHRIIFQNICRRLGLEFLKKSLQPYWQPWDCTSTVHWTMIKANEFKKWPANSDKPHKFAELGCLPPTLVGGFDPLKQWPALHHCRSSIWPYWGQTDNIQKPPPKQWSDLWYYVALPNSMWQSSECMIQVGWFRNCGFPKLDCKYQALKDLVYPSTPNYPNLLMTGTTKKTYINCLGI